MEYVVNGTVMQSVQITLQQGEAVFTEAGGMAWMTANIDMSSGMKGGLMAGLGRALSGESLFMTHFTNQGSAKRHVAFAAPYPGKIIAMDMAKMGGQILCQKDSFLCAAFGTQLDIAFQRKLGTGFFGGEGFILQRLQGDGMAFVHASGTIVERQLKGETLRVDTGCLVAFDPSVNYDIERAGNLKSMFFGGEGMFLATLSGHGRVWLQSLPFSRLADRIIAHAPKAGGTDKGEGSVLGGIGRLLDGD